MRAAYTYRDDIIRSTARDRVRDPFRQVQRENLRMTICQHLIHAFVCFRLSRSAI